MYNTSDETTPNIQTNGKIQCGNICGCNNRYKLNVEI